LANEEQLFTVTLPDALALLAQPRQFRGRGPAKPPLREFGNDPVSDRAVVAKEGRFGGYVTDGETNASIGRGDRIEEMLPERAFELLAVRREAGPTKSKRASSSRSSSPKKAATKSAAAKSAPKKTAAKKSAKKTAVRKAPARGIGAS
jgi:DNA topoisomerase-1